MKNLNLNDKKLIALHLLLIGFVVCAFVLSLYFNGTISVTQGRIDRVPTSMSWNVFLALIAYDAAYFLQKTQRTSLTLLLSLIWLGFYPNTFYMITDASHFANWLSNGGYFSLPVGISDKQLSFFGLLFVGIFMGVTLGIWSILLIIARFFAQKRVQTYCFVLIISFLSSIAIFAGNWVRSRLNTWNLVTNPLETLRTLLNVIRPEYMPFVLGFTAIQCFLILFFWLGKKEKIKNEITC